MDYPASFSIISPFYMFDKYWNTVQFLIKEMCILLHLYNSTQAIS